MENKKIEENRVRRMLGLAHYMEKEAPRYGIDPAASEFHFRNGKNYGTDYRNAQGLVVIREQWNQDKIHAMVPDDSYTIYDFLCNYSRGEDGTSYYMGVAISLQ